MFEPRLTRASTRVGLIVDADFDGELPAAAGAGPADASPPNPDWNDGSGEFNVSIATCFFADVML